MPAIDPDAPTPTYEGAIDPPASFPAVQPDAAGMVPVDAGWILLGPRHVNRVPGVPLELMTMGPPPLGSPPPVGNQSPLGQPDADPRARAGQTAMPQPGQTPESMHSEISLVPWASFGGQRLEPRRVWVDAFVIDRTEVTRTAYRDFLVATGYRPPEVDEDWARDDHWNWTGTDFPPGTGDHPVVLASWYDATEYCAWRGKRLPTEAEWQLAALGPADAGTSQAGRIFPWGTVYGEKRLNHGKMQEPNYDPVDGFATTSPVGSFPGGRSAAGLEDAFGNAWEFTADNRVDSWTLTKSRTVEGGFADQHTEGPGLWVAVRGGAYFFDLRPNPAGERNQFIPELRRKTSGLRCAVDRSPAAQR